LLEDKNNCEIDTKHANINKSIIEEWKEVCDTSMYMVADKLAQASRRNFLELTKE
jgi:hypothetical protein